MCVCEDYPKKLFSEKSFFFDTLETVLGVNVHTHSYTYVYIHICVHICFLTHLQLSSKSMSVALRSRVVKTLLVVKTVLVVKTHLQLSSKSMSVALRSRVVRCFLESKP